MSSSGSPTSFSDLPPEIRDMIWKLVLASSERRKLKFEVKHIKRRRNSIDLLLERFKFRHEISIAPTPVPSLLHVCRESRSYAFSHFNLIFKRAAGHGPIYFNSASDTLMISGPVCFEDFSDAAGYPSRFVNKNLPSKTGLRGSAGHSGLPTRHINDPTRPRNPNVAPQTMATMRGLHHVWSLAIAGGLDDWTTRKLKRRFPSLKKLVLERSSDYGAREQELVAQKDFETEVLEKPEFERWVNSEDS